MYRKSVNDDHHGEMAGDKGKFEFVNFPFEENENLVTVNIKIQQEDIGYFPVEGINCLFL